MSGWVIDERRVGELNILLEALASFQVFDTSTMTEQDREFSKAAKAMMRMVSDKLLWIKERENDQVNNKSA